MDDFLDERRNVQHILQLKVRDLRECYADLQAELRTIVEAEQQRFAKEAELAATEVFFLFIFIMLLWFLRLTTKLTSLTERLVKFSDQNRMISFPKLYKHWKTSSKQQTYRNNRNINKSDGTQRRKRHITISSIIASSYLLCFSTLNQGIILFLHDTD